MKKIYLLKGIISLIIFLSCHQLFGQNSFQVQYVGCTTCSIDRGNQTGIPVKLTLSNGSGTFANGKYKLSTVNGLYFSSAINSSNSNVSLSLSSNFNELEITVANTPSSSVPIEITFNIWAGQCLLVSETALSTDVPNAFTLTNITNSSSPVSIPLSPGNLTVNKGQTLNLNNNEIISNAASDKTIIFSYVISVINTSFDGVFSIKATSTATSYDIRSFRFFTMISGNKTEISGSALLNSYQNTIPEQNDNSFITATPYVLNVNLLAGSLLIIEESVKLNGCIAIESSTRSNIELKWGNTLYDLSCTSETVQTAISNGNFAPAFQTDKTNSLSNHACFGNDLLAGGSERSVKVTNSGNDIAYDVTLVFEAGQQSPIMVPFGTNGSNLYVKIKHTENGVTTTSAALPINYNKHNLNYNTQYTVATLPADIVSGLSPYLDGNGEISGYNAFRRSFSASLYTPVNGIFSSDELNTTIFGRSVTYSLACVGGSTPLVYKVYIDEVMVGGVPQKINLNPGDEIELFWTEYNCCFQEQTISKDIQSPNVAVYYHTACNMNNLLSIPVLWDVDLPPYNDTRTNYGISLNPVSNASTTVGEVDRCLETHDGAVERISAKVVSSIKAPAHMSSNTNGRVVFRIYLQSGLDLDKALTQPAIDHQWLKNGYNNVTDADNFVTNTPTNCDNDCEIPGTANQCSVGNVLTSPSYYFSIRPVNGNPVINTSATLVLNDKVEVAAGGTIPGTVDPRLNFEGIHANYLYEVSYDIDDLINEYIQNGGNANLGHLQMLSEFLNNAMVSFDVRAYCAGIEKPEYKVMMYIDRCSDASSQYLILGCGNGALTSMVPVAYFSNRMAINCPGCKIPGANINFAALFRAQNSRGIEDINRDNFPDVSGNTLPDAHPTMRIMTTGDEMIYAFSASMSDGNSDPTQGITQSQLEAFSTPYHLDNFYLKITLNGMKAGSVDLTNVEINGVDHTASIVFTQGNIIVLRISSQTLYPSASVNNIFTISSDINCRLTFKIDGQLSDNISYPSIALTPAFSPCDNCTDFDAMTSMNPADGIITLYNATNINAIGDNARWTCTGFSNIFQYVPYVQESSMTIENVGSCEKSIITTFKGAFNPPITDPDEDLSIDYFPEEFRSFLDGNILLQVPIPLGYKPIEITISNYTSQPNITKLVQDKYTINDPTVIQSILSSTPQTDYPKQLSFTIATSDNLDVVGTFTKNPLNAGFSYAREEEDVLPDGSNGHFLMINDEHYSITVNVKLYKDPDVNCAEGIKTYNVFEDYYQNHTFNMTTNVPARTDNASLPVANNPHIPLGNQQLYNPKKEQSNNCLPCDNLYEPQIEGHLTGIIQGTDIRTINSGLYQMPIVITNDWSGIEHLKVSDIPNPYLRIYGQALTEGLVLEGVYLGTQPVPYFNYSNSFSPSGDWVNEGMIIGIDQTSLGSHTNPVLGGSSSQSPVSYTYTLVFSYTCSDECNINLGCGPGTYQSCLSAGYNLFVEYGWDCNEKVTFDNIDNVCGKYGPLEYSFRNDPVGLGAIMYHEETELKENDLIGLNFCEEYKYKVKINSCKTGGFDEYSIQFNGIPNGVTIANTSPTVIADGWDANTPDISFVITAGPAGSNTFNLTCTNSLMTNQNPNLEIEFNITASQYFVPGNLSTTVSGVSYCGSTVTLGAQHNPISINSIFPGLSTGYCISSPDVVISPANSVSGGTYSVSSAGFTVNANGSLTFSPSTAGLGSHTFTYTSPSSCTATYTIEVYNNLPVSISVPSGDAGIICDARPTVQLTANPSGGVPAYTYAWSYTNPLNSTTSAGTTQTITSVGAGNYNVIVTDANGCSGAGTTIVRDKVDPICPQPFCQGASPMLQITTAGVAGNYSTQWYEANPSDPDDMSNPISMYVTQEGDYYGWVVTPVCTLRTQAPCHITFLPKPPAYTITANGSLNVLPDGTVDITGTAPTSTAGIASATWSNGTVITSLSNPGAITASHAGPYSITSIGTNGCTSVSNVLVVNKPELLVAGGGCGSDILSVSSNTQGANYTWYYDDGSGQQPVSLSDYLDPAGNAIHAYNPGYYWVENASGIVSATYYSVTYVAPLNAGINILTASEGSFLGLENCNTSNSQSVIGSDYTCFDQFPPLSAYNSNPAPTAANTPESWFFTNACDLVASPAPCPQMPGHYIIVPGAPTSPNGNPADAGYWNRGLWQASPMSILGDPNYMIVDGMDDPSSRAVWSKSNVSVTHNNYYKFSASIMGIDIQSPLPVGNQFEFPDYELHITRSWDNGTDVIKGQVFFTYNNSQYIDIEGIWKADLTDVSNPSAATITISIVLKGGGALGRDVAIDNVVFAPMDCQVNAQVSPQVQNDRRCSALAALDMKHKFTCTGLPVKFEVPENLYNSNLEYSWHSETDNIIASTSLDNDNNRFFNAPAVSGNYVLKVRDAANSCFAIEEFYVHVITPTLEISSSVPTACSPQDVTYQVEGYDGILGSQYKWYVNNSPVATNTIGTYTVTNATSATVVKCELISGCAGPAVFSNTVTLAGAQSVVNAGADIAICSGSSTQLTASGAVGYIWNADVTLSAVNVANPIATPTATTTYTVTGTDANGCISTDQVIITVNALPTVSAGADVIRCYDGLPSQLTASGATTYTWSPATYLSATNVANPNVSSGLIGGITYTVTGTGTNGCSSTDQVFVYVSSLPAAAAGADKTVCSGSSVILNGSSPVGNYSWSPSNGLSATNIASPTATPLTTTTYTMTTTGTITVSGVTLNCSSSDQVMVTVNALPTVNAGTDVAICEGQTSQLSASGASSYSWYPTTGLSAYNVSNPVVGPGSMLTTYTVTGTDANGCTSTDHVLVRITSKPAVNAGADVSICRGGSISLSGSGVNGCTWSPSGSLSGANTCSPIASPDDNTTYTLTTIGPWGCTNTDQVVVSVVKKPTLSFNSTDSKFYASLGTLPSGVTATNYTWQNSATSNGPYSSINNCAGLSSCTRQILKPFTKVTVTYSVTGGSCSLTSDAIANRIADNSSLLMSESDQILVYPIPVNYELHIQYSGDTILTDMTMYDVLGKEVLKKYINANEAVIDVHNIPAGVYVIHFIDGRSVMHTKRVEILH